MAIELKPDENTTLLLPEINRHLSHLLKAEWFDSDFWKLRKAISGQSVGRNITWFIRRKDSEWVLRHYYRGGLIARYLHDKYLYTGLEKTRCYLELNLLEQMYQQGLPVPKPIAARVQHLGLYYRADLLMEKVPKSSNLVDLLQQHSMTEANWYAAGAMIAKFHQAGIYHSDLNAHNILLDKDNGLWLIDFDNCRNRTPEASWQEQNLARLKRSFLKEKNRHETFHFDSMQWHWLKMGYKNF